MSQERLIRGLIGLGLSRTDARVYVFLITRGPKKGRDIANVLQMYKRQLYRSLRSLRVKGIVNVTLEHPAKFSAVPFEKVLDLLAKAKLVEAQGIERNKEEILSEGHSMIKGDFAS